HVQPLEMKEVRPELPQPRVEAVNVRQRLKLETGKAGRRLPGRHESADPNVKPPLGESSQLQPDEGLGRPAESDLDKPHGYRTRQRRLPSRRPVRTAATLSHSPRSESVPASQSTFRTSHHHIARASWTLLLGIPCPRKRR